MRGLDPRIHQKKSLSKEMDCPVQPGNDDVQLAIADCLYSVPSQSYAPFTFQPLFLCNNRCIIGGECK